MTSYVVLIRGINVGGKNRLPMADLRKCLEQLGYDDVRTYIASGNVVLNSNKTAAEIKQKIEEILPKTFKLEKDLIKVLVLTKIQLQAVVDNKPKAFGDEPGKYYCDAIFLIDLPLDQALAVFKPREGVDKVWPGTSVIYSQRLSSLRTKSRLSKIVGTIPYQSMTIRSWGTVTKLLGLMSQTSDSV